MDDKPEEPSAPGHQLMSRVVVRGLGADVDSTAIERAERAIDELSSNFDAWIDDEAGELNAARNAIRRHGHTEPNIDELFRVAHDLKGNALTYRYPLVARIGASLCRVLEAAPEDDRTLMKLIDIHVDAVRAIVRDRARDEADATATTMVDELAIMTETMLSSWSTRPPNKTEPDADPQAA